MKRSIAGMALATVLLGIHPQATAEDIDLFVQPGSSGSIPNVLFIVDNTANWNQAFDAEIRGALVNVFNNLPVNANGTAKFRVGVMFATETGSSDSNINGGYIRAAIRPMTTANKALYAAMFNTVDKLKDKGNSGASGLQFAEAYRYFVGGQAFSGNNKAKADYTGNTAADWSNSATDPAAKAAMQAVYAVTGNALSSKGALNYNSPITDPNCAGAAYIIYISNGPNQESASDDATANSMLAAAGGNTTTIPLPNSGSQANPADEWARFMRQSSMKVITYTLDVNRTSTGQGPGWTALLQSIAKVSSGKYFDVAATGTDAVQLTGALSEILSEIQAVNSVFASVSLPVSVNTEGTYLNQVYIGMFRPDADGFPRWNGNLKQYKLALINGALKTVDADGVDAINTTTGFIQECRRSYWTPTTLDTYWAFRPDGGCLTITGADASNYPDGKVVEKGAQAYMLRGTTTRTVKTCSTSACGSVVDFNTSLSPTLFGLTATDTSTRDALVNWAKGQDLQDEDSDLVTSAEMRPSAHGDVVHSRPIAINFGTDATPRVVVFYGGNDGILRAINGNRSTSLTGAVGAVAAGAEFWSFMATESLASVKRLYDNSTQINFKGNTTTTPAPLPKPYGFDGAITTYQNAARTTTWIFATMRRGGRVVYSFDVSNIASPTSPALPTLKWKVGCPNLTNDTGCTSGMSQIGQTWSAPRAFKVSGYTSGGAPAPLLVMGGGYDACEDSDPNTCTSSSKGNRIYVLDANDGSVQRAFTTDRAVAGDVFVISDSNGLAKWMYAADLGGNIYRVSGVNANTAIGATSPSNWTITKIASLGCDSPGTCTANRKFFFAPDIVEKSNVYYLLIGSGDREKPLLAFSTAANVANYFFMVKDMPTDGNWFSSETSTCSGNSLACLNSLVAIANNAPTPTDSDLAAKKGWALGLNPTEQVVTSAITVYGTTTFSTQAPAVPDPNSCKSNLGTARVYNIAFMNANTRNGTNNRYEEISGGGLPPSPVAGMVTLDNGRTVPFLIGGEPDSPLQGTLPQGSSSGAQPKSLTFWYVQK